LAGGSHLDSCFAWGVAHSTFFSERGVLWPVIEAINDAFTLGFPRLAELSKGFYDHSSGILDGCVLAVDGFGSKLDVLTRRRFLHRRITDLEKEGLPF
jgi:hypothetical protein